MPLSQLFVNAVSSVIDYYECSHVMEWNKMNGSHQSVWRWWWWWLSYSAIEHKKYGRWRVGEERISMQNRLESRASKKLRRWKRQCVVRGAFSYQSHARKSTHTHKEWQRRDRDLLLSFIIAPFSRLFYDVSVLLLEFIFFPFRLFVYSCMDIRVSLIFFDFVSVQAPFQANIRLIVTQHMAFTVKYSYATEIKKIDNWHTYYWWGNSMLSHKSSILQRVDLPRYKIQMQSKTSEHETRGQKSNVSHFEAMVEVEIWWCRRHFKRDMAIGHNKAT